MYLPDQQDYSRVSRPISCNDLEKTPLLQSTCAQSQRVRATDINFDGGATPLFSISLQGRPEVDDTEDGLEKDMRWGIGSRRGGIRREGLQVLSVLPTLAHLLIIPQERTCRARFTAAVMLTDRLYPLAQGDILCATPRLDVRRPLPM